MCRRSLLRREVPQQIRPEKFVLLTTCTTAVEQDGPNEDAKNSQFRPVSRTSGRVDAFCHFDGPCPQFFNLGFTQSLVPTHRFRRVGQSLGYRYVAPPNLASSGSPPIAKQPLRPTDRTCAPNAETRNQPRRARRPTLARHRSSAHPTCSS